MGLVGPCTSAGSSSRVTSARANREIVLNIKYVFQCRKYGTGVYCWPSKSVMTPARVDSDTFLHLAHCLPAPENYPHHRILRNSQVIRIWYFWVSLQIGKLHHQGFDGIKDQNGRKNSCLHRIQKKITLHRVWPLHQVWQHWFLHRSTRPPHVAPAIQNELKELILYVSSPLRVRLSWTWGQGGWRRKRLQKGPREESKS